VLRCLCLTEIPWQFLTGLLGQSVEIASLCRSYRIITADPIGGVLLQSDEAPMLPAVSSALWVFDANSLIEEP
jgi:hypothetical protein